MDIILFASLVLFSVSNCVAGGTCSDSASPYFKVTDAQSQIMILLNNSAIGNVGISTDEIQCVLDLPLECGNAVDFHFVWKNEKGGNVSTELTSFIRADGDTLISTFWNGAKRAGIYTCLITNSSDMTLMYEIHIGLYESAYGKPVLLANNVMFALLQQQFYPLVVVISAETSKYPPTNVFWEVNGVPVIHLSNCGFESEQRITDRLKSKYSNILTINESHGCTYDETYSVSVNTNGEYNVSVSFNITKISSPVNLHLVSLSYITLTVSWQKPPNEYATVNRYCLTVGSNVTCTDDNSTFQLEIPTAGINESIALSLLSIGDAFTIPSHPETINISLESPSPLQSMHLNQLNSSAIQIKWTRITVNDQQYIIPVDKLIVDIVSSNCSLFNKSLVLNITNVTAEEDVHIVSDLYPAVQYCVTVRLSNPWGDSEQSEEECFVTSSSGITDPVSAPVNVTVTIDQLYCSPISITWSPIPCTHWNGPFKHYNVCFTQVSESIKGSHDSCDILTQPNGEITELKYYTLYRVRVARVNIGGFTGPFSNEEVNFTTTECLSESPVDLNLTSLSTKTCGLQWKPPININGVLQSYLINYCHRLSLQCNNVSINYTLSHTLTQLYPNNTYTIEVAALNGAGKGVPAMIEITTQPIGSISTVTVDSLLNTLIVTWTNVSDVDYYIVSYAINPQLQKEQHNISVDRNDFTIKGVANDTRYTIGIAAGVTVNEDNIIGPWTNRSGCHGNCPDDTIPLMYIAIGGGGCVVLIVLMVTVCAIAVSVLYRRRKVPNNRVLLEMQQGGEAPSIATTKLEDLYVTEGADVTIHAPVTGQPYPEITWFFNNDIIADDGHFCLDEEDDSSLLLQDVLLSHAGVYRFTATNSLGSVEGQIRVLVKQEKQPVSVSEDNNETKHSASSNGAVVSTAIEGKSVTLNEFGEYVSKMNKKNKREFKRQFQNLQNFDVLDHSFGALPENKRRNRFENILPYNNNRIVLEEIDGRGDCNHTYINASYIDGHVNSKQFIATQGPLPQTLVDFWRLIWQERVHCIVILLKNLTENSLVRCQQYWPDSGAAYYGPYKVTLELKETHSVYIKRVLKIAPVDTSSKHPPRVIDHIQFTRWTDDNLPSSVTPLVTLVNTLRKEYLSSSSSGRNHPTLVHCSAGIGRTGALLSAIIGVEMGLTDGYIDVLGIVNKLRKQRMKMIQTEEQYAFVHYTILEGLYCRMTTMESNSLRTCMREMEKRLAGTNMTQYQTHFKALNVLSPNPDEVSRNKAIDNPRLSRSKMFLPPDNHRVVLQKKKTDFIHASFLNGYNLDKVFIVAESPTVETGGLFWQMIFEQKCAVIVMLCDCVELGEDTCYPYWPASVQSEKHFGEYRLKNTGQNIDRNYTELQLQVTDVKNQESLNIAQLQVPQWSPSGESSTHQSIVSVVSRVEVLQRSTGNKPILVHCSDTVTRSGVFCTLYNAVQQCKLERVVNIYQTLKQLRSQKPALVPNEHMYKMVFELLERYSETEMELYKNISMSKENLVNV